MRITHRYIVSIETDSQNANPDSVMAGIHELLALRIDPAGKERLMIEVSNGAGDMIGQTYWDDPFTAA